MNAKISGAGQAQWESMSIVFQWPGLTHCNKTKHKIQIAHNTPISKKEMYLIGIHLTIECLRILFNLF